MMNILIIPLVVLALFYLAYRFYAKRIEKKVFEANDSRKTPAVEFENGVDYVPTSPLVVFSHHFSSIAGAGPIVGPTLALAFGYMPVLFWIVIGTIFIGGVHDFTTMFSSVREKGRSIAEIVRAKIGKNAFLLVIAFTIVMLFLVTAVFLKLVVISLTSLVPLDVLKLPADQTILKTVEVNGVINARIGGIASTSVIIITLFAPLIGIYLYKMKGSPVISAIVAILICAISVFIGLKFPVTISPQIWTYIISVYVFLAAGIPVWLILQPRDFINSFFLYAGIFGMLVGSIVVGIKGEMTKIPAFDMASGTKAVGNLWPFLFITVACGAISGFHSLVAGGTSSKQVKKESDVIKIGYGGMILEGILAMTVVVTVAFALKFDLFKDIVFAKSNPNLGFALSLGILMNEAFNLPIYFGTVMGILLLEGFLMTTLDTAVRLNRYLFEELWSGIMKKVPNILKSYQFNALLSVVIMLILSQSNTVMQIWKIFGAANQLLAAIALLIVTIYLKKQNKKYIFTLIPTIFMGVTTIGALLILLFTKYLKPLNITLLISDIALLILSTGIIYIAIKDMLLGKKTA
jgi:carbon starvation protein